MSTLTTFSGGVQTERLKMAKNNSLEVLNSEYKRDFKIRDRGDPILKNEKSIEIKAPLIFETENRTIFYTRKGEYLIVSKLN